MTAISTSALLRVRRPWSEQSAFLPVSMALEEQDASSALRDTQLVLSGLLAFALVWAAVARVDEVAPSTGIVVPAGRSHVIQHYEGGIVADILVQDGQRVDAGQPLVRLDPAGAKSERGRAAARVKALTDQAERLKAFAAGHAPPVQRPAIGASLAGDQHALFLGQFDAREAQRRVVRAQIEQADAENRGIAGREDAVRRQVAAAREERDTRKHLFDKGLGSKLLYLDAERRVADLEGSIVELAERKIKLAQASAEARARLAELDARLKNEALLEYGRVTGELAELRESLGKLDDRVVRLDIIASVAGVVKGLAVNAKGAVLAPGAVIAEIVPEGTAYTVEARLDPRHAGHVGKGQPVQVKISAYDYAAFGALAGTVEDVSASTFEERDGRSYYKVLVNLDASRDNPMLARLWPGMTATVDIVTGEKSVLSYLLKPIAKTLGEGFRER